MYFKIKLLKMLKKINFYFCLLIAIQLQAQDSLRIRQFTPTELAQTPFEFTNYDDRIFTVFKPLKDKTFVPLTSFWNYINDNYLATPSSEKDFNQQETIALRHEGYVLNQKERGTRSLELFYNDSTKDYMVSSSSRTKSYAQKNGYVFKTILGYVFEQSAVGLYPLYLFYNHDRHDFALFATKRGVWDAFKCNYNFISIEGFVPMKVENLSILNPKK
jgi:hypothetical protein